MRIIISCTPRVKTPAGNKITTAVLIRLPMNLLFRTAKHFTIPLIGQSGFTPFDERSLSKTQTGSRPGSQLLCFKQREVRRPDRLSASCCAAVKMSEQNCQSTRSPRNCPAHQEMKQLLKRRDVFHKGKHAQHTKQHAELNTTSFMSVQKYRLLETEMTFCEKRVVLNSLLKKPWHFCSFHCAFF